MILFSTHWQSWQYGYDQCAEEILGRSVLVQGGCFVRIEQARFEIVSKITGEELLEQTVPDFL